MRTSRAVRRAKTGIRVGGGWWVVVGGWWLVVVGCWLLVGGWWLLVGGWWLKKGEEKRGAILPCQNGYYDSNIEALLKLV